MLFAAAAFTAVPVPTPMRAHGQTQAPGSAPAPPENASQTVSKPRATGAFAPMASADPMLAPKQRARYIKAFKEAERERWARVKKLRRPGGNALADKLLTWTILRAEKSGAGFDEIAAFIAANDGWPDLKRLRRRAEEAVGPDVPTETLFLWFRRYPPVSPDGAFHHARALEASGRIREAARVVRDAWVGMEMGRKQADDFRRRFHKYIGREDDIARLDTLLWKRKVRASRRQMRYVPKRWRRYGEARIALMIRARNATRLLKRVPPSLATHQGIVFERVRWRRRARKMEDAIDMLLANRPDRAARRDRWWRERNYLARWALQEDKPAVAYSVASDHAQTKGVGFAEAEWLSGWIALRRLDDPENALRHFKRMYERVNFPVSRSRGAYWIARAYETIEKHDEATEWYREAARHMTRFYGQAASGHLPRGERPELPREPEPGESDTRRFEARELVRAIRMLAELDRRRELEPFLLALTRRAEQSSDWILAARLAREVGRRDTGVSISKRALREGVVLGTSGYPELVPTDRSRRDSPEQALIYAVVRQESAFDPEAISRAGARGLMQIMPQTARRVARRLRVPYSRRRLTRDPTYNLRLGQAYLADVLADYDGSLILALAAYNAGPLRVERWLRQYGDPGPNIYEAIDWIESIPFRETRAYVQRVLENLIVYRGRENGLKMALTLAALELGPFKGSAGQIDRIDSGSLQDGDDFAGP